MSDPFSTAFIHEAIQKALINTPVPAGKKLALVAVLTPDGVKGYIAAKVGSHWQMGGEVELHADHKVEVGASVVASW